MDIINNIFLNEKPTYNNIALTIMNMELLNNEILESKYNSIELGNEKLLFHGTQWKNLNNIIC
jgi:hypothetical protein